MLRLLLGEVNASMRKPFKEDSAVLAPSFQRVLRSDGKRDEGYG